jgi:hypothetical protein
MSFGLEEAQVQVKSKKAKLRHRPFAVHLFTFAFLPAYAEFLNDLVILVNITTLEIIKQFSTTRD